MQDILFYMFSAAILVFALLTVRLSNLLHAALALIACLFASAGLFVLLRAEFVAIIQIMVYVGGVVIFIVYAILLTTHLGQIFTPPSRKKRMLGGITALALAALLGHMVLRAITRNPAAIDPASPAGSIRDVGNRLLATSEHGFIVPFEIISILLLAALVGAISIASRDRREPVVKTGAGDTP